ncbi:FixH family protein [Bacillus sp. REN16]|uniref:FixH family protein n=1 Tax=Bacillus sp. REN16 TaxID=2887296 RepID=UPI001E620F4D|nr:FixH family protein [Bacillus sp. REN16]MCC3359404.1 FixH family protein [Bacillus sp. REN16]
MKRKLGMLLFVLILGLLAACGTEAKNEEKDVVPEELKPLEVEFIVPEKADPGEKIQLKAIVTYGDEKVKDADEMKFEYWESGNDEEKTMVESTNNGDGSYTAEVAFDHDGVYEMYAHTTARSMHTMPKTSITIGEGAAAAREEEGHEHAEGGHDHGHAEGFSMHFTKPEAIKVNQDIDLAVHLQLDNEALTKAQVRYEIIKEGVEKHNWVDAVEAASGEYKGTHSFTQDGAYTIVVHVQNDSGLHEHEEHVVEVSK